MIATLTADHPPLLSIAAVERETGLGKDTLRVWEKRYGFPMPERDGSGDRRYPVEQVRRLQMVSRLLATGLRPGKVVGLDQATLESMLHPPQPGRSGDLSKTNQKRSDPPQGLAPLLEAIARHDPDRLRHSLAHAQWSMGLAAFVTEVVAPLAAEVGQAWAQGRFEIFEEHLFTEVVTGVLRQAIGSLTRPAPPGGPKVLLTTLPSEMHGLGLLMVESLLSLEGCACVSLGTQTPVGDVARAAQAHRADVVALSFSDVHQGKRVWPPLSQLRALLPAPVALWAGGSCRALQRGAVPGITVLQDLSALRSEVAQWRAAQR